MFSLDNLGFGLRTFLLGMVVIFAALALIWIVVFIVGKFFSKKSASGKKTSDAKKSEKSDNSVSNSDVKVVLADPTPAYSAVSNDSSAEIVAAITAAICAYENKLPGSFRVVSFKKR